MRLFKTPPYQDVPELLDAPGDFSRRELETTLRDIRRANIFGLGTWVVLHHLKRLVRGLPPGRTLRVLDLATGSADIPEELCRWARREGRDLKVVASDISEAILQVARQRIEKAGFSDRVDFVVSDAARPAFASASFDVVICSLAFHHLDLRQARVTLGEMARIARVGFIVNDIYRAKGALHMARFLTWVTTTSKLTRHDGPASVLRAFTPTELRRLSCEAGVEARVYTHAFWRVAVLGGAEGG